MHRPVTEILSLLTFSEIRKCPNLAFRVWFAEDTLEGFTPLHWAVLSDNPKAVVSR